MKIKAGLFSLLYLITLIECNNGNPTIEDINRMSLNEAKEKGYIYEVFKLSEGLQGATLALENPSLDYKYQGRLGFFDETGKVLIPFSYLKGSTEKQEKFNDGLAPAAPADGKVNKKYGIVNAGYINKSGGWVIKPQFIQARSFNKGVAYVDVEVNGKRKGAYIKPDGSYFIKPRYSEVFYFPPDDIAIFQADNGKWGLCKPDGTITAKPTYGGRYSGILDVFEGRALASVGGKLGFIDLYGNNITVFEFDMARNFINGTAIVVQETGEKNTEGGFINRYGIIDREGNYLIPLRDDIKIEYYDAGYYNGPYVSYAEYSDWEPWYPNPAIDGVISVKSNKTGFFGLMNLKGEWVIEPIYSSLHFMGNKRFKFVTQDKKIGVMGTDGKIIK